VRGSDSAAFNEYMASLRGAGARSVGELVDALAARGRPVTRPDRIHAPPPVGRRRRAREGRAVRALLDPAVRRVRHLLPLLPRPRRRHGRPPLLPVLRRAVPGPAAPGRA
jgi:hypothetical protein